MRCVGRTLLNPALQQFDFPRLQQGSSLGRWHHFLRIGACDAADEFTVLQVARFDGENPLPLPSRLLTEIESQFGFAGTFVRSMTMKTLSGQEGLDLGTVIDGGFVRPGATGRRCSGQG